MHLSLATFSRRLCKQRLNCPGARVNSGASSQTNKTLVSKQELQHNATRKGTTKACTHVQRSLQNACRACLPRSICTRSLSGELDILPWIYGHGKYYHSKYYHLACRHACMVIYICMQLGQKTQCSTRTHCRAAKLRSCRLAV